MSSLLHVSITSNHHQADISVLGHDMISAYSMGSHIVYTCCIEFKAFRLINCSILWYLDRCIIWNRYEPINV